MIQFVDRALERFLRRAVPLPEASVDIAFEAPDRTWGAALTRPTVNVFLWQVTRNPALLRTGLEQRVNDAGELERRRAQPVVDLHYLVTSWATELSDEHQLLGAVLECVLANGRLPEVDLGDRLAGARCALKLATRDARMPNEFWSSLDGRLKPGLQIELSLPVEVFSWAPTAQPAESIGVGMDRLTPPPPAEPAAQFRRRRANGALVMEGRPSAPEPGA